MIFNPNELFVKMCSYYSKNINKEEKVIFCNEGGSRSSKTWDFIHFVAIYCDNNRNKKKDIYVLRDTLVNCRDFTLKEFEKCFTLIGLDYKITYSPKPIIILYGNNIYFRGLDDEKNSEGFPSDISFINEAQEVAESQISGILMRCVEVFAMDWNPKFTQHWVYKFEFRKNCLFTHSTYLNNKHLPISVINEIESYNPEVEENIINGTADEYRWQVYGLGLRCSREGLVVKKWTRFSEPPKNYDLKIYGMDFGYTNDPTGVVELIINGKDLYITELLYETGLLNTHIFERLKHLDKNHYIVADSADPKSIDELRGMGLSVINAVKGADSIRFGIAKINTYNIFIHENSSNLINELHNYSYKIDKKTGVSLNIPIDKFNHLIDPIRYGLTLYR